MEKIAVIDYGMGNLHSVATALEATGEEVEVVVTGQADIIRGADKVVFPGVGALGNCVAALRRSGVLPALRESLDQKPCLGICLGMQALMTHSEENGGTAGLGVIEGEVRRFDSGPDGARVSGNALKVPHMGWNRVVQVVDHPLWRGVPQDSWFYFVHSYYVIPKDQRLVAGQCHYGRPFAAAVAKDNLFAVQFHPEKSQRIGIRLLRNFLRWNGR